MEQSYAEANAKRKMTGATVALKIVLIVLVLAVFLGSLVAAMQIGNNLIVFAGVAAIFGLIWYWPRFKVEWEYVFCDGQLDFDMIQGGEKRKNVLRIEIEDADVIAPVDSKRLDGYRHLETRDYSSMREDAKIYGIAIRLPEKQDKIVIFFEPTTRMLELMHKKCPEIVEYSDGE